MSLNYSREQKYGPTPTRESVRAAKEAFFRKRGRAAYTPELVASPDARKALTEQLKKRQAIERVAGFIALGDELTPDAARRILHEEEGPSVVQEARALVAQAPELLDAGAAQRQTQDALREKAIEVIMNSAIGDNQGTDVA